MGILQSHHNDNYVFESYAPKNDLAKHWSAFSIKTYVAEETNKIFDTYIKPNQIGLGEHIANCGYMVHPSSQGNGGIGKLLCKHSLQVAKDSGFKFGTIPNVLQYSKLGHVDPSYIKNYDSGTNFPNLNVRIPYGLIKNAQTDEVNCSFLKSVSIVLARKNYRASDYIST